MEETLNEIFSLFHIATEVKRSLLKYYLQKTEYDVLDFLKDNAPDFLRFSDVQKARLKSSFIGTSDLSLGTVNFLLGFCTEMFWECCYNSQDISFEGFLNNHKTSLTLKMDSYTKGEVGKLPSDYIGKATLSKNDWCCLFDVQTGLAKPGVQVSQLDKELSFTLLNVVCPLLKSVNVLIEKQTEICKACVEKGLFDQIKVNEIWDTMKLHILNVARYCKEDRLFKSEINVIKTRPFNKKKWLENQKSILDVVLSDKSFIEEEEFCDKARTERDRISQEETKIAITYYCGREITLTIHGSNYQEGQYPVAVIGDEEQRLETKESLYRHQICERREEEVLNRQEGKDILTKDTAEKTNYLKLTRLLNEIGRKVLMNVVKARLPGANYGDAFNGMRVRLKKLLVNTQRDKIFPQNGKYTGDLTDLDISILYIILRSLNTIPPHGNGWGQKPDRADRVMSANIERLRIAKNDYISHPACFAVTQSEFTQRWREYRQCITELGGSEYEREIDEILTSSLDPIAEGELLDTIKQQQIDDRGIKEEILENRHAIRDLKENLLRHTKQRESSNETGLSTSDLIIRIETPNVPRVADEEKSRLDSENISVTFVKKGSLVIGMHMSSSAFQSVEYFLVEIDGFLFNLFTLFPPQAQVWVRKVTVGIEFCDPPSFNVVQQKYSVVLGKDATLRWHVSSVPCLSNVYFKRRNTFSNIIQRITEGNVRHLMGVEGQVCSLVIHKVERQDQGFYTCLAENRFGLTESIPIELKVTKDRLRFRTYSDDKAFHKRVNTWTKVRSGTLPKLGRLKKEMKKGNTKIRMARWFRNITVIGSVATGIIAAPITGFTSIPLAASTALGVSGAVITTILIIDSIIEKGILDETQSSINEDAEATLVFLAEIRFDISEASQNEFKKALEGIQLEAIGKLTKIPLNDFLNSFVDTNSKCLMRAIAAIDNIEMELSAELEQVQQVDRQYN